MPTPDDATTLERAYVASAAAKLAASYDLQQATKLTHTAVDALRDAAPSGEAALTPERLGELQEAAIELSGVPEDSRAVQEIREALAMARRMKEASPAELNGLFAEAARKGML